MAHNKSFLIAVDFDGTIVENKYPKIGEPITFAFETLKKLQEAGHRLILWTYRYGKELDDAVKFCEKHGIVFYAVNQSFPEEVFDPRVSRKINADIFIDDRNIGGLLGWGETYHHIMNEEPEHLKPTKKKGLFSFFK
ncbi:hydrolase [Mesonia sp. MT50]|uniref:Hydrolase n=1 Tax=Mesonia profundi TaxID=3070998 RepID=A0ABU1A1C1_9FLAO|nr:hydrolase [Mesonia profundi]MDQ7917493.1 hydrolase [Mesonia profundi]